MGLTYCYDVYQILEDGDEKFVGRYFDQTPIGIAKMLADEANLEEQDWELKNDNITPGWFWFQDNKSNENYRIQLFQ